MAAVAVVVVLFGCQGQAMETRVRQGGGASPNSLCMTAARTTPPTIVWLLLPIMCLSCLFALGSDIGADQVAVKSASWIAAVGPGKPPAQWGRGP